MPLSPTRLSHSRGRWLSRDDDVVEAVVRGACTPSRRHIVQRASASARRVWNEGPIDDKTEALLHSTSENETRAYRELEKVRTALEAAQSRERALVKEVASLQEERKGLLQKHAVAAERVNEASAAHEDLAFKVRKEVFCKGKLEKEVIELREELRDSKQRAKTTLKTLRERLSEVEQTVASRHAQAQGPLQVLESCARRVRSVVKSQPSQLSQGGSSAPIFWIRLLGDLDAAILELEALLSISPLVSDAHKSSTFMYGDAPTNHEGSRAQQQQRTAFHELPPNTLHPTMASQPQILQAQLLQAQSMSRAAMEERDELAATNALLLHRLATEHSRPAPAHHTHPSPRDSGPLPPRHVEGQPTRVAARSEAGFGGGDGRGPPPPRASQSQSHAHASNMRGASSSEHALPQHAPHASAHWQSRREAGAQAGRLPVGRGGRGEGGGVGGWDGGGGGGGRGGGGGGEGEELVRLDAEMVELQKSLERAAQWLA